MAINPLAMHFTYGREYGSEGRKTSEQEATAQRRKFSTWRYSELQTSFQVINDRKGFAGLSKGFQKD